MDQHQIDWQAVHVLVKQAALRAVKRQLMPAGLMKPTKPTLRPGLDSQEASRRSNAA
jgi:hypothetical protein